MSSTSDGPRSAAEKPEFDEVIADLMRAIDAGHEIDPERWPADFPQFAEELRDFFAGNEHLEKLVRPLRKKAADALHVRCPHCRNAIELLDELSPEQVSCPSCGSSFSLVGQQPLTEYAPGERTIGHFELLQRVGIGAFGGVWKARDTRLDRTVAIKLPRGHGLDEAQTRLFLRDAQAAAQLKHPNIVRVHEVGTQDDTI